MDEAHTWTHAEASEALAQELGALRELLVNLSDEEWTRPTRCRWNADHPWDVRALVAHINISIGMTAGFAADLAEVVPDKDRVSFFINDPRLVAPIVDEYAWKGIEGQTPADLRSAYDDMVEKSVTAARDTSAEATAPAFFGPMTMGELLPTRVLEAVVHGHDVSEAVGRPPHMTPTAKAMTVQLLEDLLERRATLLFPLFLRGEGAKRPADLADDMAFIEVATGRRPHSDPRFPILQ
jgi:uncharacterized protein (TIGR03083 family)